MIRLLSDAVRDRDTIRAVIRSIGFNQDDLILEITVSNDIAQKNLIRQIYKASGLNINVTKFFKAHKTSIFLL